MNRLNTKFKKGATSVYVVVIATLLFSVITVSFIRIIINETNKTTSDELAQSAYDSALAGVEDAKAALKRYYECKSTDESNRDERCGDSSDGVIYYIEKGFKAAGANPGDQDYGYCDAVSKALGRNADQTDSGREVLVKEVTSTTSQDYQDIAQAYTCVMVNNLLNDYRSRLEAGAVRVVPLRTEYPENVTGIRISWLIDDDASFTTLNYLNNSSFGPLTEGTPTPPTISAQVIQTASTFTISDFENSKNDCSGHPGGVCTDRGTVILVPSNESSTQTHVGHLDNDPNKPLILATSNDHSYSRTTTNTPQKIKCQAGLSEEFACVATIELPDPILRNASDKRNKETFFLVLTLPYGQPPTHFSVELCTDNEIGGTRGDCKGGTENAKFIDAQIAVDSTGRANDMYSRVEARVEFADPYFPYSEYAIQATGSNEDAIKKDFYVTENCFITKKDGSIIPCSDDPDNNDTGNAP